MVGVLDSYVVDRGFENGPVKPMKLVFVFASSPLHVQHLGSKSK